MNTVSVVTERFFWFLKKNGAYTKWFKNAKLSKLRKNDIEVVYKFMMPVIEEAKRVGDDYRTLIQGAFIWADTAEGHEYWENLNNAWIKLCAKLMD